MNPERLVSRAQTGPGKIGPVGLSVAESFDRSVCHSWDKGSQYARDSVVLPYVVGVPLPE